VQDNNLLWVEELFQKYRNNFDVLDALFKKKGISNSYGDVKVKGEVFTRFAYFDQTIDLTVHSCGQDSYPKELEGRYNATQYYLLSNTQKQELSKKFESFQINLTLFDEAVQVAKGFWIEYLSSRNWETYFNQTPRRPELILNFTGQLGDILGLIVSDYSKQVLEIAGTPLFKKIDGTDGPRVRQGVISDYFLFLFMRKYYLCSHFESTTCIICTRKFYPQCDREWVNRVPPVFCQLCLQMGFSASDDFYKRLGFSTQERRENYIEGVRAYSEYFGFIPAARYQKRKVIQHLHQAGIPIEELIYAMKVSSLLPWTGTIKQMFGSWSHFLNEAGLLSQKQKGRGGHKSIASDGHLCLSMGERAICEFLTKKGIAHSKEPMYPFDETLNPNGLLRGDFYVEGVIIEFAGMMSNSDYASKMKNKSKLAEKKKIPWLKLETADLDDLLEILPFIDSKKVSDK